MTEKSEEVIRLENELESLKSQFKAWFEIKAVAKERLADELIAYFGGYLRVSRCGGLSTKESDSAMALFEGWAKLQAEDCVMPILIGLAKEFREELTPHPALKQDVATDQELLDSVLKIIDKDPSERDGLLHLLSYRLKERAENAYS